MCIPQISKDKLISEDLQEMTIDKCEEECVCIKKNICKKLLYLLKLWYLKDAQTEYKKYYK